MKKRLIRFLSVTVLLTALITLSCGKKEPAAAGKKVPAVPRWPKKTEAVWEGFKKFMPRDTFLYVEFRDWVYLREKTPALDFLKTARDLRLGPRLREWLKSEEKIGPKVRQAARRLEALRDEASFWEVFGADAALAGFADDKGEKPTLAFLSRLPDGKGEYYEKYFKELIGLSDAAGRRLTETTESFLGETLTSLSIPDVRVQIQSKPTWCRAGDVFILSSRPEGTRELLARIKGEKKENSLSENKEFRKAFRGLDVNARGVFYLKMEAVTGWARRLYEYQKEEIVRRLREARAKKSGGEKLPALSQARYYLKGLLKLVNTADVIAGNSDFSRDGYHSNVRYYLNEKGGSLSLLALLRTPPRDWDMLDRIPAKSAGIEVSCLNTEKLYRSLLSFVAGNPAHGKLAAAAWEEIQKKVGFNPEEDIFSWLGDECGFCTVSLARTVTDTGSFAFLAKVKSEKEEKMEAAISRLLSFGQAKMKSPLNVADEEYEGIKLRVVYLPIPFLPLTPTLGKVGDCLVLASRKEAFKDIVDTFNKKEKNIRQDPDFIRMRERISPRGTNLVFNRLEERTQALISLLKNSSSLVALAAAGAAEPGEGNPPPELATLLNDVARVMEDLRVFKFWGKSISFKNGYLEFREFIEIGERQKK